MTREGGEGRIDLSKRKFLNGAVGFGFVGLLGLATGYESGVRAEKKESIIPENAAVYIRGFVDQGGSELKKIQKAQCSGTLIEVGGQIFVLTARHSRTKLPSNLEMFDPITQKSCSISERDFNVPTDSSILEFSRQDQGSLFSGRAISLESLKGSSGTDFSNSGRKKINIYNAGGVMGDGFAVRTQEFSRTVDLLLVNVSIDGTPSKALFTSDMIFDDGQSGAMVFDSSSGLPLGMAYAKARLDKKKGSLIIPTSLIFKNHIQPFAQGILGEVAAGNLVKK